MKLVQSYSSFWFFMQDRGMSQHLQHIFRLLVRLDLCVNSICRIKTR